MESCKAQTAVDVKHDLIAAQEVHDNTTKTDLLAQTVAIARQQLTVERADALPDNRYYRIGKIDAYEAGGVATHVSKPVWSPWTCNGFYLRPGSGTTRRSAVADLPYPKE